MNRAYDKEETRWLHPLPRLSLILIIGAALALLVVRYALVITTSFQRRTASDKDCSAPARNREVHVGSRLGPSCSRAEPGPEPMRRTWTAWRLCMRPANRDVVVVTADRELAERVRAANAVVVGPSWLLDQLVD